MINTSSQTVQDFQYQTLYRLSCRFSVSKQKYLFLVWLTSHDECTTLPRNAEIRSPTTQRHIPLAHRHSATSQLLTTTQCHIPTAHQRHSATPQQLTYNKVPHPNSSPTTQCHIPTEINPQQHHCKNPKSRSQSDIPNNKKTNIKYTYPTSVWRDCH
jgi:hypothetical protein